MPRLRDPAADDMRALPRRELSRQDKRKLTRYRSYIRNMLHDTSGNKAALELSAAEIKRVATIKRWLHRAAQEEGVRINVKKRGGFLIFEPAE
jgi:hypothetical protein